MRSRFKGDVLAVDRVWLDIDEGGPGAVDRILRDARGERIAMPRVAIETSPGRAQVVWQLERGALEPDRAEALMRGLVAEYGGDRAAVDVSRVLRWPGFRNWKRGGEPVRITWQSRAVAEPEQFPAGLYRERGFALRPAAAGRAARGSDGPDGSRSGRDWRRVIAGLKRGAHPEDLKRELELERQDKSNPRYYASLTVDRAEASLSRGR